MSEQRVIKFKFYYKNRLLDTLTLEEISERNYHWADDVVKVQFTGLLDKNGKEIYEGDIVIWEGKVWRVIWCKNHYGFEFESEMLDEVNAIGEAEPDELLIIGNIYENPELLEKAGK